MSVDEQAAKAGPGSPSRPRVFVSYSHDSPEHKEKVRQFATFLRTDAGVDVHLDVWYDDGRRDWSVWAIDQLTRADFVLAIASPEYKRRADGSAPPDQGRGAQFEAAMIRNNLTRNLPEGMRRVLPVVLPGGSIDDIPEFLCAYSATRYVVSSFTVEGIQDLLVAFTGLPLYSLPPLGELALPVRPSVEPVVVAASVAVAANDVILSAGAEIRSGPDKYLVHGESLEERPASDHSAVWRQARALRIGPPHKHVWLRQVEVRQETSVSEAAIAALRREHKILGKLAKPGLPQSPWLAEEGPVTTLATAWPMSTATKSPYETLLSLIPRVGEDLDPWRMVSLLRGMAGLCRTLASLHKCDYLHRCLTPESIIQSDGRGFVLRDIGLVAHTPTPGEGPVDYQAPEQQRRRSGRIGPWTDVYQVAAVTYHLLTGRPPDPAIPLPIGARVPELPVQAGIALDAALAVDPVDRPEIGALEAALRSRPS